MAGYVLALQGRRGTAWCVGVRKGGGYVVQHSGRGKARSIPASGLSEEQLSGTSLGYVPISGML
jgi:hypothetical protein